MNELRFGTAGKPTITKGDTVQAIKDVKKLGLDAMELEFVRGINITKEKAPEVNKIAKEKDVVLTCHGPYFINLNSEDTKKFHASVTYITNSAKIMSLCNGYSVCFHAGYYQGQDENKVYEKIKEGTKKIIKEVKEFDSKIWIRPEISGKISQFGNLKELIKLSQEVEQVMPCIDFAHLYARTLGKNNTKEEFKEILKEMEKGLGKEAIKNMHIHISGIEFGDKGEKNHLTLKESKFNYLDCLKTLKEFNCKGIVVCESPIIEKDALILQKTFNNF